MERCSDAAPLLLLLPDECESCSGRCLGPGRDLVPFHLPRCFCPHLQELPSRVGLLNPRIEDIWAQPQWRHDEEIGWVCTEHRHRRKLQLSWRPPEGAGAASHAPTHTHTCRCFVTEGKKLPILKVGPCRGLEDEQQRFSCKLGKLLNFIVSLWQMFKKSVKEYYRFV